MKPTSCTFDYYLLHRDSDAPVNANPLMVSNTFPTLIGGWVGLTLSKTDVPQVSGLTGDKRQRGIRDKASHPPTVFHYQITTPLGTIIEQALRRFKEAFSEHSKNVVIRHDNKIHVYADGALSGIYSVAANMSIREIDDLIYRHVIPWHYPTDWCDDPKQYSLVLSLDPEWMQTDWRPTLAELATWERNWLELGSANPQAYPKPTPEFLNALCNQNLRTRALLKHTAFQLNLPATTPQGAYFARLPILALGNLPECHRTPANYIGKWKPDFPRSLVTLFDASLMALGPQSMPGVNWDLPPPRAPRSIRCLLNYSNMLAALGQLADPTDADIVDVLVIDVAQATAVSDEQRILLQAIFTHPRLSRDVELSLDGFASYDSPIVTEVKMLWAKARDM